MVEQIRSLAHVMGSIDRRVVAGGAAAARVWPTGFSPLDDRLTGGLRGGEVVLLGGAQGVGKTTMALQVFRQIAAGGGEAVYFSFEHDEQDVLQRLLVQEAHVGAGAAAPTLAQLRRRLEAPEEGVEAGLAGVLHGLAGMDQAQQVLHGYGDRLAIVESSSRRTTPDVVRDLVLAEVSLGKAPVVFIDYLQKVNGGPSSLAEDDRVTVVVEALKDLALEAAVPVVAVVAATREGIARGHRIRVHELRGSSALAYEADVILLMNNKHEIVAKQHLAFDSRSTERFKQVAVVTIEKNRSGRDHVDLEFGKQFEHCRFDPVGNVVVEQLVDVGGQAG